MCKASLTFSPLFQGVSILTSSLQRIQNNSHAGMSTTVNSFVVSSPQLVSGVLHGGFVVVRLDLSTALLWLAMCYSSQ